MAEVKEAEKKDSGKKERTGCYVVCHGAICKCDSSKEKKVDSLDVKSQTQLIINEEDGAVKCVGTTKDVAVPFKTKAATFGSCLKQPTNSGHKPCTPSIRSWKDAYKAIEVEGASPLVEDSVGMCSFGGKVTFVTHGQTEVVSPMIIDDASVETTPAGHILSEDEDDVCSGEIVEDTVDDPGAIVLKLKIDNKQAIYHPSFFGSKSIKIDCDFKGEPSQAKKDGVNWAIFYKATAADEYALEEKLMDEGEKLYFHNRKEGYYAVEAYGSANGPYFLKKTKNERKKAASIEFAVFKQGIEKEIKVFVGDTERTGRIRPTEAMTLRVQSLFPTENFKDRIEWTATVKDSEGTKDTSICVSHDTYSVTIDPIGTTEKVTLSVTAVSESSGTKAKADITVWKNTVEAVTADKETICVYEKGSTKMNRHELNLRVSKFNIMPATQAEKDEVKWILLTEDEKPDNEEIRATGDKVTWTANRPLLLLAEAYSNNPYRSAGVNPCRIKFEAIHPSIEEAFWAEKDGKRISRSGCGHKVHFHILTKGLVGETIRLNLYKKNQTDNKIIHCDEMDFKIEDGNGESSWSFTTMEIDSKSEINWSYFFTLEEEDFYIKNTYADSDVSDEMTMFKDNQNKYLKINNNKEILSFKILEEDGKTHTGTIRYAEKVVFKIKTRNYINETLTFDFWQDKDKDNYANYWEFNDKWDDRSVDTKIDIKTDEYGYGEAEFAIPSKWQGNQIGNIPSYYYLKYGKQEFPRTYYVKDLNKKIEEDNQQHNKGRVRALMLKVTDIDVFEKMYKSRSAVLLGEELVDENEVKKCGCEARVRAYMRMLRFAEGTEGESGYTKLFGHDNFTKPPHNKDMSRHPEIPVYWYTNDKGEDVHSTAAGAYQIMRYNYWELEGYEVNSNKEKTGVRTDSRNYIKIYGVPDFSPKSQDLLCVIIFKHKRKGMLDLLIKGEIEKANTEYGSWEWASIPPGRHGQPEKTMSETIKKYEEFLAEELNNKSDLHLEPGFLREVGVVCCKDSYVGSAMWQNPLKNCQITIHTMGGHARPWRSAFGKVRPYNDSPYHAGLDLFATIGTDVYACLPGKVISITNSTAYGTYGTRMIIKVDDEYIAELNKQRRYYKSYYIKSKRSFDPKKYKITDFKKDFKEYEGIFKSKEVYLLYAHLGEVFVKEGQEILEADMKKVIAKTGDSGATGTKGPHLHFEIKSSITSARDLSDRYNPAYYINYKNEEQLSDEERRIQDKAAGK